jgi:hypothetical protein
MSCLLSKVDDFIIAKKIPVSRKFFGPKPGYHNFSSLLRIWASPSPGFIR